jgi:hypothetical protein
MSRIIYYGKAQQARLDERMWWITPPAAASHALSGRLAQAQKALSRMREIDPDLRISNLAELVPFRAAQDFSRYVEGLRQAGLPE